MDIIEEDLFCKSQYCHHYVLARSSRGNLMICLYFQEAASESHLSTSERLEIQSL